MHENLERRLAAARERVGELSRGLGRDNLDARRAAREDQLKAERDLASARGEQYAQVIDTGPRWDAGASLPHLISNGSRAFVVCLASQPGPEWDGTYVKVVSPAGSDPSLFVVIEMRGCSRWSRCGLLGDPVRRSQRRGDERPPALWQMAGRLPGA